MSTPDAPSGPASAELSEPGPRWATAAVESALYRAFIGGTAMWQVVLLIVVLTGQTKPSFRVWLLVLAAFTLAAAVLALFHRFPPLIVAVGLDVMVVLLYAGVESRYNGAHLAAVWTCVLAMFIPAFVARARVAIPFTLVTLVAVIVLVGAVQPDWAPAAPIALAFATAWGAVAAQVAARFLRSMSLRIDQEFDAASEERRAAAAAELAAIDAAEDARTMHDTVINTLAAIAAVGSVLQDREAIRSRCSTDLLRIESLIAREPAREGTAHLDEIPAALGLSVEIAGLPVAQVRSLMDRLPERAATALRGVVREALVNAAKHAQADRIVMTVLRAGDGLEVVVADDGVGFEADLHPGRGLERSVFARATGAGIRVDLVTGPGEGTVLRFRCPGAGGAAAAEADPALWEAARTLSATQQIVTIRRTVCWAWAVGMLSLSAMTAVRNGDGEYTQDYPMLAGMGLLAFLAWWHTRGQRDLPTALALVLIASVPVAFVASFASVDYGRGAVSDWQTLGVTAPIVVLLMTGRTLVPFLVSMITLAVTVVVTMLITFQVSPEVVEVVPVGAAPALLMSVGLFIFQRATQVILERSVEVQRTAFMARVRRSAGIIAARSRERWRSAGLRDTAHLLGQIADGDLDPKDPDVQAVCGVHEEYLRNVCMLSPRATNLGAWLGHALAEARARSVRLAVRTSDIDVADAEDAQRLGSLLLDAVGASPTGSVLTVGVFHSRGRGLFTLVGRSSGISGIADAWSVPLGWELSSQQVGEEEVVEVSWPVAAVPGTVHHQNGSG